MTRRRGRSRRSAGGDCVAEVSNGQGTDCTYTNLSGIGPAAALTMSSDGKTLYLATLNQCLIAIAPRGDNQNLNCNNDRVDGFTAEADVYQLNRNADGTLTPGNCYANATFTPEGSPPCVTSGFDGLYTMTSLAVSPDGQNVYVTGDAGALAGGALSRDPGEIVELSRDPSTGDLTPMTGAQACVTAGTACSASDAGVPDVAGLADPQQLVISPDGKFAYATSSEYLQNANGNTALVSSTLTSFARDTSSGALTPLAGAACFAGEHEACESAAGPSAPAATQVPALTGAEALAISPDGDNVYVHAQDGQVSDTVVSFARDNATGLLTPVSPPSLCLGNGTAPGATSPNDCAGTTVAGLSSSTQILPGDILVSADCANVYVASDGVTEFGRAVPAGGSGCAPGGGTGGGGGAVASPSTTGLTFGVAQPLAVGSTSAPQVVTITNTGTQQLGFGAAAVSITGATPAPFALSSDACSRQTLAPGQSCAVAVTFTPTTTSAVGAQLSFSDTASGSPQTVSLTGVGSVAIATLSVGSLGFGTSAAGKIGVGATSAQTVTVTDTGRLPLPVSGVGVVGPQASAFAVGPDSCLGTTVASGGSCSVTVTFAPHGAGSFTAALEITDGAGDSPQAVALVGAAGVPTVEVSPTSLDFSAVTPGEQLSVTVVNTSAAQLTTSTVQVNGPDASVFRAGGCSGIVIDAGESCNITVRFVPPHNGVFNAQLTISDNAPDSPQTVSLTADVHDATIEGHVRSGATPAEPPLGGVQIYACPAGRVLAGFCVSATTDAAGAYETPPIGPGQWVLQTSDAGQLVGASAEVTVTGDSPVTQDFVLHEAHPLEGGATVDGASSGVPTIHWTDPFSYTAPVSVPKTGAPDSNEIFTVLSGMTADAGAPTSGAGFNSTGIVMFDIHYGADGTPVAMSTPMVGSVDCSASADGTSPCAQIADGAELGGGGSAASAASLHARTSSRRPAPVAHTAACGGAIDMTIRPGENIIPNQNGGVNFIYQFGDGTSLEFDVAQAQFPPVNLTGNPLANTLVNWTINAANFGLNFTPAALYNALVGSWRASAAASRATNPALAHLEYDNMILQAAGPALQFAFHGTLDLFTKVIKAVVGGGGPAIVNWLTGSAEMQGSQDCPPLDNNVHVDPSGQVETTTHIPLQGAKVVISRSPTAKGRPVAVPNGSPILSSANRRNPDHTSITGQFGWDVLAGYYRVAASRPGCHAAHRVAALTPVFPVPPPRANLLLELRCPPIHRAASSVAVKMIKGTHGTVAVIAVVAPATRRGPSAHDLVGSLTFTVGKRVLASEAVGGSSHRIVIDVAGVKTARRVRARFGGNAVFAPSSATLRRR